MRQAMPRLAASFLSAAVLLCAGCNTKPWAPPLQPEVANEAVSIRKAIDLVRAAQRLEFAGKDVEAMDKYIEAIQTYRETPIAWNNLGRLKMKQGELLAAAEAFKVAADLSPTDPVAPYNLGTLWQNNGYLADAGKWYSESIRRDENYLLALRASVLVDQYQGKGNEVTAERLRKALLLETDPAWRERLMREDLRLRESLSSRTSMPR